MKKLILFTIVWCIMSSAAFAQKGTVDPKSLLPKADLIKPNVFGGYDYYIKGKKVAHTTPNIHGSFNFYHMNRLKYRGIHFANTGNTAIHEVEGNAHGKSKPIVKEKSTLRPSYRNEKSTPSVRPPTKSIKTWTFWFDNP